MDLVIMSRPGGAWEPVEGDDEHLMATGTSHEELERLRKELVPGGTRRCVLGPWWTVQFEASVT